MVLDEEVVEERHGMYNTISQEVECILECFSSLNLRGLRAVPCTTFRKRLKGNNAEASQRRQKRRVMHGKKNAAKQACDVQVKLTR